MEKRAVSSFVFPAEMGDRLRALRRRAGLSIVELAHLVDRKPGFGKPLSQLDVPGVISECGLQNARGKMAEGG